jgi:hypothetical protein
VSRVHIPTPLRRLVIDRANGRCEYCLLHQDDTPITHAIDHIVAIKHGGETEEHNLAFSCIQCNLNKGSDLFSIDPLTGEFIRLFNPREQRWDNHFALQDIRIIGRTPCGRTTVRLLRMNTTDRLAQREILIAVKRYPGF